MFILNALRKYRPNSDPNNGMFPKRNRGHLDGPAGEDVIAPTQTARVSTDAIHTYRASGDLFRHCQKSNSVLWVVVG